MSDKKPNPPFAVSLLIIYMAVNAKELSAEHQWEVCCAMVNSTPKEAMTPEVQAWLKKILFKGLSELLGEIAKRQEPTNDH